MKKSQEQFIIDAYNNDLNFHVCEDVKGQIKKVFPDLEYRPKIEFGKYYKLTKDYCCIPKGTIVKALKWQHTEGKYVEVDHEAMGIFGHKERVSTGNYLAPHCNQLVLATEEEITKALYKEAHRREYFEGTTIIPINTKWKEKLTSYRFKYNATLDCINMIDSDGILCSGKNFHCIYADGRWAEIIPEPTIPPDVLNILGHYSHIEMEEFINEYRNNSEY